MPYHRNTELPSSVRNNLPEKAQEIYRKAFNSAWDEYEDPEDRRDNASREETAHKVAWAAVKKEYRAVRESGIAYCREEIDRGLMGIAAPLHLPQIGVIYAVSIVGPSNRIREHDEQQLEASLIRAAGELSEIFTANLRIDRA